VVMAVNTTPEFFHCQSPHAKIYTLAPVNYQGHSMLNVLLLCPLLKTMTMILGFCHIYLCTICVVHCPNLAKSNKK
jgi:hypothetical protein